MDLRRYSLEEIKDAYTRALEDRSARCLMVIHPSLDEIVDILTNVKDKPTVTVTSPEPTLQKVSQIDRWWFEEIISKWKDSWLEEDDYFERAVGIDANMKVDLSKKLTEALHNFLGTVVRYER